MTLLQGLALVLGSVVLGFIARAAYREWMTLRLLEDAELTLYRLRRREAAIRKRDAEREREESDDGPASH